MPAVDAVRRERVQEKVAEADADAVLVTAAPNVRYLTGLRDAGHGEHFQQGLGHGVGLEVHEAPMIGYSRTGKLASRVPVTVEPGVHLPGRGGVRIEDVLVVGAEGIGGSGLLTTTTRELLVLLPGDGTWPPPTT